MSTGDTSSKNGTALIVGCGYVGRVLARELRDTNARVFGTVRHEQTARSARAHGATPLICDVTDAASLDALSPALQHDDLDVYYLVPPGGRMGPANARQTVIDGANAVIDRLSYANVRRVVICSSTGVYGQVNGEVVTAETPPQPQSDRAKLLIEGEQVWLDGSLDCRVVRLAGLYGPDRVVGLSAIRQNSALVGQGDAWLNLIHVDDAVELLRTVMQSDTAATIELGSDGTPIRRFDYYNELAVMVGAPPVRMISDERELAAMGLDAKRIASTGLSKRCDPSPTINRTGWSPLYPSFREGFRALAEVVLRLGC